MNKKRLLSLLLCFALIAGMFSFSVFAKGEADRPAAGGVQEEKGTGEEGTTPEGEEEPPILPVIAEPIKMTAAETPCVGAGESVSFEVEFTAEEGYTIGSVEMLTSTDPGVFPFHIEYSSYKAYYSAAQAKYALSLTAREEAKQGYYKIPVAVSYTGTGGGDTVQFQIPVFVTSEKSSEGPEKEPERQSLPKVIVSCVSTDPAALEPGQRFLLTFTVENTSSYEGVKNMKVTVLPQGGAFSSSSGTTSAFISWLGAGCCRDISMEMVPRDGLTPGVYGIDVRMEYDSAANETPCSATETITVSIGQKPRAEIARIETTPYREAYVGESILVKSAVYNVGKVPLYNVFASVGADDGLLTSREVFLGNIDPGAARDISAYVSALTIGNTTIRLEVRFEDERGVKYELHAESPYSICEKQHNGNDLPEPVDDRKDLLQWLGVGAMLLAAAAGTIFFTRKKKKTTDDIEE